MSVPAIPRRHSGFSARALAKAIFDADMPEQFIRTVPAQSLFMAVKHNGVTTSGDLIEIATLEQCRLMLDFDCWEGDRFAEERFWEWLALSDEETGLRIIQKLLRCVDLKLIALLISRYVNVKVFEDPTENPPGPGHHTPDKGYTWLGIEAPDADKHFLLARLLALIFETDAELFYQLINIPNVSTAAILEEESLQERTKRLATEGIPDTTWAHAVNAPMTPAELTARLADAPTPPIENIAVIEPMIHDSRGLHPLNELLTHTADRDSLEMELTLIANAALVFGGADFGDFEAAVETIALAKGTLNVGLERALELRPDLPPAALAAHVGLQAVYRLGRHEVLALAQLARRGRTGSAAAIDDAYRTVLLEGLSGRFPRLPLFLDRHGTIEPSPDGRVSTGLRPIEHLDEIVMVRRLLDARGGAETTSSS